MLKNLDPETAKGNLRCKNALTSVYDSLLWLQDSYLKAYTGKGLYVVTNLTEK